MELPELLMIEHASFRLQFRYLAQEIKSESYLTLHDFILNCHAKVEDEALFPRLWGLREIPPEFIKTVRSLAADHKLISKFGESLHQWIKEGNQNLFNKRIGNYINTVEDHNSAEEKNIFPSWKLVEEKERKGALSEAKKIIEGFGVDKYTQTTGISREFYYMFW